MAAKGNEEIFNYLVRRELSLCRKEWINPSNESPLHWAVLNNNKLMVWLLIQEYKHKNGNVDEENINKHTPLFLASIKGFQEVFSILLEEGGANINH